MTDRDELTAADRATLATIDAVLDNGDLPPAAPDPLADFSRVLRDSAPQADATFRQRLRAEVVGAATAAQAERDAPWWRRRLTRRQIVAAGIAGVGLGGAAAATARVIAALDDGGGTAGGEESRGWSLDQYANAPFSLGPNSALWTGARDARYVYSRFQVPRARWGTILGRLDPQPVAGTLLALDLGGVLPIPAYLPSGFTWQGTSPIGDPRTRPGPIGSTSGGGRSGNLPWQQTPHFDAQAATYLVGGDAADRFIVLAQLRIDGHPDVRASGMLFDVPERPVPVAGASSTGQGGTNPTPTPPPTAYAARIDAVVLAQPAAGGSAVAIRHGAAATQDVAVNGRSARSFVGVWDASGTWNDTTEWINLVWEQGGYLYHLAAQQLPLAELIRVAESLPPAP